MMDNIESVLKNFFFRMSSDKIIEKHICGDAIGKMEFCRLMRNYSDRYSDTELENLYNYLTDSFFRKYYGAKYTSTTQGRLDVFSLLKCYSAWILTFQGNEIVCEYGKMFHWRRITDALSEDLIVAAFLADWEERKGKNRIRRFDWKPFLTHNNEELRKIVKKGICENHYHLKGSAPIFQLTWINLMNDISSREFSDKLKELETNRRNTNKFYERDYKETGFEARIKRAALIRVFLTAVLLNKRITIGEYPSYLKQKTVKNFDELWQEETERNLRYFLENPLELNAFSGEIQSQVKMLKLSSEELDFPDYAMYGITDAIAAEQKGAVYQGERWFIYEMLRSIYRKNEKLLSYQDLFYAYLVIKESVRAEMVQIKRYAGFENFKIYQDRKEWFLENSFMNNLLVKEAVQSSFLDSNVVSLEARITPKESVEQMRRKLNELDSVICGNDKKRKKRIFYTLHFIKTGLDEYKGEFPVRCRHYRLRQKVEKQALALAQLRERFPKEGSRIRGIDAANMEIGCGPEVFAQAFRFLRDHMADECNGVAQLHMTYHVGEDFLDMVSGLRAIDETIHFMNMRCGSRLGHALALGVDPCEWYEEKNERIILPQQEYLDNVVWLFQMLRIFRVSDAEVLRDYLKRQFHNYFSIIYKGVLDSEFISGVRTKALAYYKNSKWAALYMGDSYEFDIDSYYCAWALRGDNPNNYRNGFYENEYMELNPGNKFSAYAINSQFPGKQEERYFPEAGILYYLYHFNGKVREEGQKCIEVKVKPFWKQAIRQIQKGLQHRISQYGIGIETNPTSNYKIGTFKRYDKHPIINFYNNHLVSDERLLSECEQLNVSINTDDQGVFNTSLENEYAYMALALEKAKDLEGKPLYRKSAVYAWIDDIRKMGIRQTFLNERELGELVKVSSEGGAGKE